MRLLLITLLAVLSTASAGKKKNAPAPPPPAPPATLPLQSSLPVDLGTLPEGLAHASAQGCHACHVTPVSQWQQSKHASGPSEALLEAADALGEPACLSCHQPLLQQHASLADGSPNPAWDATLSAEGVTCAACHIADGRIVGTTANPSPHASGANADLASPTLCASCHQLTWPGASTPLYDTFGEWSRSRWAEAGVTCQDCHMGAGAGTSAIGADHRFRAEPGRALSLLLQPSVPRLVRGADPAALQVTLQNTGAGHHVPSGSPFTQMVVHVRLVPPDDSAAVNLAEHVLGQTFTDTPPWIVTADTRLPAGSAHVLEASMALPASAPAGRWWIDVTVTRTTRGVPSDTPSARQRVPIVVE